MKKELEGKGKEGDGGKGVGEVLKEKEGLWRGVREGLEREV